MSPKKNSTPMCDLAEGTRNALNFTGDVLVDSAFGIGTGLIAASFPEASIPAIVASSITGQAVLSNLFADLTNPVKTTIHGLNEKIIPDSCKPAPKIIPMGETQVPAPTVKTEQQTTTKVVITQTEITNIMVNLGVSESQLENIFKNHNDKLTTIEEKLDKVLDWQKKQDKAQAQQSKYEDFQSAQALCSALSALGKAIGCKELMQGAAILGAGVQIGLGIAMCVANPIMGVGLIIGGIAGLFGLVSNPGPSPEQLILDSIGKLADQVTAMHGDMVKLFDQNFKMQKILLEVMQQGTLSIKQLIKGEIESFRVNMQASLARIETMQRDLAKQTHLGQQQLYLKDFVRLQAQVEDEIHGRSTSDNIQHQITATANEITTWATRHSVNPLLNGANWRQIKSLLTDRENLDSILSIDPSISANNVLGFFVENLPHPVFWLSTVNLFTQLTGNYWNISIDPDQRESIKKIGIAIINFCEGLNKDEKIWKNPIDKYYTASTNIQNAIEKFIKQRSLCWVTSCNQQYELNEHRKSDAGESTAIQKVIKLKHFNLLAETVDTLIQQFNDRTANQIQVKLTKNQIEFVNISDSKVIGFSEKNLGSLEQVNLKTFYHNLNLPREILCAEYLGLISSIEVRQTKGISGLNHKAAVGKDNKRALILTESLRDFTTEPEWQLEFEVIIKFSNGEIKKLETIKFSKPWSQMPKIKKFWDENRQKEDVGKYDGKPLMHLDSDDTKKYFKQLLESIVTEINNNSAEVSIEGVTDLGGSIKKQIEQKIIQLRQQIAKEIINGNVNDDAQSQGLLENLKIQFTTLDFWARQLQHLLYYAGKDLNVDASKLISSDDFTKKLREYIDEKNPENLSLAFPSWFMVFANALKPSERMLSADLQKLPQAKLAEHHPLEIAKRGILMLDINVAMRRAMQQQFPLYAHYIALQQYQTDFTTAYIKEALREIYKLLEKTFAVKFNTARHRIHSDDPKKTNFRDISAKDYKKFYHIFKQWCISTSKEPIFVGDPGLVRQLFFSPNNWQPLVQLKIARGWEKNIAALYELACLARSNQRLDQQTESKGLVNYVMWRDGMKEIVKMIVIPGLSEKTEKLVDNPIPEEILDQQETDLTKILQTGQALYSIIEDIGLSPIVDKLFDDYVATFEQLLKLAENQKQQKNLSNYALYQLLIKEQFAGSTVKLLDALDADRLLLQTYAEMILDYFPWQEKFKVLKTKEQFLAEFDPKDDAKFNFIEKLTAYHREIIQIKEFFVNLFAQLRELIKFRDALLALAKDQSNSIVSLEGSILVFNADEFQFGFDTLKANLLNQFLNQFHGIDGIRFIKEDFTQAKNLTAALHLVSNHPEIHTMMLTDCQINAKVLEQCGSDFKKIDHIHQLDLSDNPLINSANGYIKNFDIDRIKMLLTGQAQLNNIILYNTGVDDQIQKELNLIIKKWGLETEIVITSSDGLSETVQKINPQNVNLDGLICMGPRSLHGELTSLSLIISSLKQRIASYKAVPTILTLPTTPANDDIPRATTFRSNSNTFFKHEAGNEERFFTNKTQTTTSESEAVNEQAEESFPDVLDDNSSPTSMRRNKK